MSKIIFHEDSIEIRQYEFQVSNVRNIPIVTLDQINEVNLNTFPPSIVINHNEVIFIETRYKIDFMKYVKEKKLKVNNRFDIWGAINESFLDTEFTEQHQERTLNDLKANGIEASEVESIRSEVEDIMQGWAAIAWEWNYLGQYDLLLNKKQSFLLLFPKEFYWWTMDIALRNYQKIE
jgi:hypothetical protein